MEYFGSYDEMIENYLSRYKKLYGLRKFDKIKNTVLNSKKLNSLVQQSETNRQYIPGYLMLECINSIRHFIFSSRETQGLVGLLVLEMWNEKVNKRFHLLSDDGLQDNARDILNKAMLK